MIAGKYVYCIIDDRETRFSERGFFDEEIYIVKYNSISAVVSSVPFKEIEANVQNITSHQIVVDEARKNGAVIPVRFGVIFKDTEGVLKLLKSSCNDFKKKLEKFKNTDEYGLKIILEKKNREMIKDRVMQNSSEIISLSKQISDSSQGKSYFLKMKLDEAVRNEALQKIEELTGSMHREISTTALDTCLLKDDLDQIVLNSSYLVNREKYSQFKKKIKQLKSKYEPLGFTIHLSGPWAPYSFC